VALGGSHTADQPASTSVLGDLDNNVGCSKAGLLSVYSNLVGRYIDEPASFRRWRPSFAEIHRIFSFFFWLDSYLFTDSKMIYITINNEYSRFY